MAACYFLMYVGVVVMDKQAEHRYMRVQSLSTREHSLKEEYDAIQAMLLKAEELDTGDNVPVPK
jgi:chaperonin cofactor prefoldin